MDQDVIWDHFQNEGRAAFSGASPRVEYIVRRLRRGERVLDIGVGSGVLERLAARKGIEIWALDPSARSIEELRAELGLGERAQAGYSQAIPFPDNHFHAVVMSEVLEHLDTPVRHATLTEVRRVLRPGGRLIGTVPAREQLAESQVVCPSCAHQFHRWGHTTSFDISSLCKVLEREFRVETAEERFFNDWDSAPVHRRLTGLLKKFLSWRGIGTYGVARNIFFVGRKIG